jgi:hypothetical protein
MNHITKYRRIRRPSTQMVCDPLLAIRSKTNPIFPNRWIAKCIGLTRGWLIHGWMAIAGTPHLSWSMSIRVQTYSVKSRFIDSALCQLKDLYFHMSNRCVHSHGTSPFSMWMNYFLSILGGRVPSGGSLLSVTCPLNKVTTHIWLDPSLEEIPSL